MTPKLNQKGYPMDQSRRKILLSSSALPLTLLLPGCGGGGSDASSAAVADTGGRVAAQAVLPSSGGYIEFVNVISRPVDNAVFRYTNGGAEYLRYFVPAASTTRTQAVLNTSSQALLVRLTEVIQPPGSTVTHHRCVTLTLPACPAIGASALYDGSTLNRKYAGSVIVNTTTAAALTSNHYEYDLQTGGIRVTHTKAGTIALEFIGIGFWSLDAVDGAPNTSQTFSTVPTTTAGLRSGSNLAVYPFLLLTAAGRPVNVSYVTENGAWV